MASAFDWVKLSLENFKVIVPILLLLVSVTGYTITDNMAKTQEIKDTQQQLTNVANHYAKSIKPLKPLSKPLSKPLTNCCRVLIDGHLKEHH